MYVKFDPLIGGRPSVMGRPSIAPSFKPPAPAQESLIDMNSPSPGKKGAARREEDSVEESQVLEGDDDDACEVAF